MQHLSHDAILRPEDFVDSELGPGLIYPYDPSWQRLDLWLAAQPRGLDFEAQLALIRQIAEALQYAHGKNVVHRGLNPRAILVRTSRDGRLQARITDWQGVGRTDEAATTLRPAVSPRWPARTRSTSLPPRNAGSATPSPPRRASRGRSRPAAPRRVRARRSGVLHRHRRRAGPHPRRPHRPAA